MNALLATAFLAIHSLDNWHWDARHRVAETLITAPTVFNDVVMTLNARALGGSVVRVKVRAAYGTRTTKFYTLAEWSESLARRRSIDHQKDADGDVQTDTWLLTKPTNQLDVRVEYVPGPDGTLPHVYGLDFSFVNSEIARLEAAPNKAAWGTMIPVAKRNQGDYENGGVICSPTSLSMILNYYGEQLARPDLTADVPEVAGGVFDQVWGGTGNWCFNASYAASRGMRSYVTRLNNIAEAEAWILAGRPLACSVSYGLLRGHGKRDPNDGHLVVLIGFTAEGDPIFNDPGSRAQEHHTYKRADFDAAWSTSGRTVYVVLPPGEFGPNLPECPWEVGS